MQTVVRLAGRATLTGGGGYLWSVADGRRGRRWRSTSTTADGRLMVSLLVETAPGSRLTRFEAVASAGLMTLHPEPGDSILHGNVVAQAGVDHIAVPWSPEHALLSFDEPILLAVCIGRLRSALGPRELRRIPVQYIDAISLDMLPGYSIVERSGPDTWRLLDPESGRDRVVQLDADGLFVLPGGVAWPLET